MRNLLTAIIAKCTGSALSTAVGGRIYEGQAPESAAFPNVVLMIIASIPDDTFTEALEQTVIQFSLRSTSQGLTEIATLHAALQALFDDAILTVTNGVNVMTTRDTLSTTMEDIVTPAGTVGCRHWAVDYTFTVQTT